MTIQVLGPGCKRCAALHQNTIAAAGQLGLDTPVEKIARLRRDGPPRDHEHPRAGRRRPRADCPATSPPSTRSASCSPPRRSERNGRHGHPKRKRAAGQPRTVAPGTAGSRRRARRAAGGVCQGAGRPDPRAARRRARRPPRPAVRLRAAAAVRHRPVHARAPPQDARRRRHPGRHTPGPVRPLRHPTGRAVGPVGLAGRRLQAGPHDDRTYDRVADMPLHIDGYALDGLTRRVSTGFRRFTTVFRLTGAGLEGVGEDVTYEAGEHRRLQRSGPRLGRDRPLDARDLLQAPGTDRHLPGGSAGIRRVAHLPALGARERRAGSCPAPSRSATARDPGSHRLARAVSSSR